MKYLFILITLGALCVLFLGCSGKRPENLGVNNGRLSSCPDSPNCVSTQATDEKHSIAPVILQGTANEAMAKIKAAIESMDGAQIILQEGSYLHAEFTSRFWRFVDDLECYYDETAKVVHVRSASRVGISDLDVNRKRVEQLRKLLR